MIERLKDLIANNFIAKKIQEKRGNIRALF